MYIQTALDSPFIKAISCLQKDPHPDIGRRKKLGQGLSFQISNRAVFKRKNRLLGGPDRQNKSLLWPAF
jgi:hypothetical protein